MTTPMTAHRFTVEILEDADAARKPRVPTMDLGTRRRGQAGPSAFNVYGK